MSWILFFNDGCDMNYRRSLSSALHCCCDHPPCIVVEMRFGGKIFWQDDHHYRYLPPVARKSITVTSSPFSLSFSLIALRVPKSNFLLL